MTALYGHMVGSSEHIYLFLFRNGQITITFFVVVFCNSATGLGFGCQ